MAVTDNQVATLHAQLRGDYAEYERLFAGLDKSDNAGYTSLIAAAFVLATERRFRPGGTRPDIILYVANVRSQSRRAAEGIDPKIGERLILAALTGESVDDIDADTAVVTELLLLVAMTAGDDFPESDIDKLLAEARATVDRVS